MRTFGIYKIVNTITEDIYIGSTTESFTKRWNKHLSAYRKYKYDNCRKIHPKLFNAIDKYGIDNFKLSIMYSFTTRKPKTRRVLLMLEERMIRILNPKYNICKEPTKSGSPNLGRKLNKTWRNNIRKKSLMYRHGKATLKKVTINNKENSSIYLINGEFRGSLIECAKHYNVDIGTILNTYNGKYQSNIIKTVVKEKSQKKKITIFMKEHVTFESYSECDRFFNKWRGYTSTIVTRGDSLINGYKYSIFND